MSETKVEADDASSHTPSPQVLSQNEEGGATRSLLTRATN